MLLVTVVALFAIAPAARAATFTVVTFGDELGAGCNVDGSCASIRAAVNAAAQSDGSDTIVIPGGDFQLVNNQIVIGSDVTIVGAGARNTTIRGDTNAFRAFEIAAGVTASITGVTLNGGQANGSGFRPGGLIRNNGSLTLDRVRVTRGFATSGGGVANTGGTLTINRSLIDGNDGGSDSGGLMNFDGGTMVVRNTTITNNRANQGGAYLSWKDSGRPNNTALFEFVTIARNTGGGGLNYSPGDTLQLRGSIVANNIGGNCLTAPQSLGNNVETSDDCLLEQRGAGNAVEDELENRGGDTDVLPSVPGSAAADLIPAGQCLPTDQRGIARPIGPACDAGAFEAGTAPVTITSPAPESTTDAATVELRGTAEPNASVTVYRNGASVGQTGADVQGAWALTVNLDPGGQTFEVEAPGVPRASVRVVRTVSTTITAPAADTYTNAATLDFAGTATPGVGVDLYRGTTLIEESGADNTGAWSFEDIELGAEGEYSYRVEVGGQSATVRVVVDRTQPAPAVAAPATEPEAATLTFGAAAEPTASFACRLEGPGRGPEFAPCSSPARYERLTAGAYRFTVRAVDAAGNTADSAPQEFTIAGTPPVVVPETSATPTPSPRPTETPAPQPDVGESVVIRPTAGRVLIQLPGSSQFVVLPSIGEIPLGATIDTRNGRIQLRFETEDGKVQTATFYGGIFQIRQVGKILDLKLTEPLAACPKKGKAAAAQTKKVKKRKLWGDGKGSFRTTGKYSAATVRGTRWLVEDSCAGTLTRVTIGVVAVRAGKKTVLVRAGKRYLAKPR